MHKIEMKGIISWLQDILVYCVIREFCSASDVSSLMTQEPRFEAIHLFKGGTLLLGVGHCSLALPAKTDKIKHCDYKDMVSKSVCTKKVENLCVFLLVCGLRRVKDPLYLLEAFAEWHSQNPLVVLIIIGPKMDPVFTVEVEESVK
ncbi:hypothetical protein cypCar_00034932, partial [Cyprinus carpio]